MPGGKQEEGQREHGPGGGLGDDFEVDAVAVDEEVGAVGEAGGVAVAKEKGPGIFSRLMSLFP